MPFRISEVTSAGENRPLLALPGGVEPKREIRRSADALADGRLRRVCAWAPSSDGYVAASTPDHFQVLVDRLRRFDLFQSVHVILREERLKDPSSSEYARSRGSFAALRMTGRV
jgi:hypothetical protein